MKRKFEDESETSERKCSQKVTNQVGDAYSIGDFEPQNLHWNQIEAIVAMKQKKKQERQLLHMSCIEGVILQAVQPHWKLEWQQEILALAKGTKLKLRYVAGSNTSSASSVEESFYYLEFSPLPQSVANRFYRSVSANSKFSFRKLQMIKYDYSYAHDEPNNGSDAVDTVIKFELTKKGFTKVCVGDTDDFSLVVLNMLVLKRMLNLTLPDNLWLAILDGVLKEYKVPISPGYLLDTAYYAENGITDLTNQVYVHPQHYHPAIFSGISEETNGILKNLPIRGGEWFPLRFRKNNFNSISNFPLRGQPSFFPLRELAMRTATAEQMLAIVDAKFSFDKVKREAGKIFCARFKCEYDAHFKPDADFFLRKISLKRTIGRSDLKSNFDKFICMRANSLVTDSNVPVVKSPIENLTLEEFTECVELAYTCNHENVELFNAFLAVDFPTMDDHFSSFTNSAVPGCVDKFRGRLANSTTVIALNTRREGLSQVHEKLGGVPGLDELVSHYLLLS